MPFPATAPAGPPGRVSVPDRGQEGAIHRRSVAVVGAGPSGLTAIKAFGDLGFDVTGFDRCDGVGGNWRFDDRTGHSSVFETTHIISSKHMSGYEDFPLPDDVPDYPSHTRLLAYFEAYADEFGLGERIRFGTTVTGARPTRCGRWTVTWQAGGGARQTRDFDALCIASGHHHEPRWPDYPGEFTGEYIHSHDYKRAAPFAGKRVLVIGGGNSACDVAVETARVSKETCISWRRGYHLIPKFVFGQPTDLFFYRFRWLPRRVQLAGARFVLERLQGRNRDIGLPDPDHQVLSTHPTLNSELYLALRHGKVHPKGDVSRFDGTTVHFRDGSSREFDAVLACTGFRISHPFLDRSVIDLGRPPVRLHHRMMPENLPNLYFIGLFQPLGCIWPGAELQARLAARHLAGLWKPRGHLGRLIDRELARPDVRQIDTPRHTITVDDLAFRKRLRAELARARRQSS